MTHDLPRSLFDALSDVVWSTATDGSLLFLNGAVEELYGRSVAEVGANWSQWLDAVHADDLHISRAVRDQLEATGQAPAEYRIRRPDGDVRWVRDCRRTDGEGAQRRCTGVLRDITAERVGDEEAAKAALLRDVVQNIPDYVMRVDREGRIGWINRTLPTLTIEGVLGTPVFQYLHPDIAAVVRRNLERAFSTGQIQDFEISGPGPLDEPAWYRARMVPAVVDGTTKWVTYLATDITRAKQAETREREARHMAESANRMKSEFLANVSHEMRTPLTAILGFAEYGIQRERSAEERLGALETSDRNGKHLLRIINDVLDLAKIESGELDVEPTSCDLQDVVSGVIELCQPRAADKQIVIVQRSSDEVPATLWCDTSRLRQILVNLIDNAIKFTAQGEVSVELSTVAGGTQLWIAVRDTGIGLTADEMAKIFEPFVQADASKTQATGGTGLGLAISRRLAKLLGGQLTVDSRPNRGSTFTLELPIRVPPASTDFQPRVEERPAGKGLAGQRVLLVEDGDDNRRLIRFILAAAGAEVAEAADGYEGIAAVVDAPTAFDAVIMDMQMPRLDGYAATGQIRQGGYEGPIVALTANVMGTDEAKCLEAGCDAYATKPIDRVAFISTVAACIVNRRNAVAD